MTIRVTRSSLAKRVPVQCGENWWGAQDLRHAIDTHASRYVMLDVMKTGGVTGWLRAAALAEIHGIPVSSHLWPEISLQLLNLTPTAHWLKYADWWNLIVPIRCGSRMAWQYRIKRRAPAWSGMRPV